MEIKIPPERSVCVSVALQSPTPHLLGLYCTAGFVLDAENTVMTKYRPCSTLAPAGNVNVKKVSVISATVEI